MSKPRVLAHPVYLAGPGTIHPLRAALRTRGWAEAATGHGRLLFSPHLDTFAAHLPEGLRGGWQITHYGHPYGIPLWLAAFSRDTPSEVITAFATTLADDPDNRYDRPSPARLLTERGWRPQRAPMASYLWSPDGHAYLSTRTDDLDDDTENPVEGPARWNLHAGPEPAGDPWHAVFTARTPFHLVTAAADAASTTIPVLRDPDHIPALNRPHLTITPALAPATRPPSALPGPTTPAAPPPASRPPHRR
jgi:hypothetical protein